MKQLLITGIVAKTFEVPTDDEDEAVEIVATKTREEMNSIGWDFMKIEGYFLKKVEPADTLDDEVNDIKEWLKQKEGK